MQNFKYFFKKVKNNFILLFMYHCKKCNYSTNNKSHYNKHLNTEKHKNMFVCLMCNTQLSSKSSYYRHIKGCNIASRLENIENRLESIEELLKSIKVLKI